MNIASSGLFSAILELVGPLPQRYDPTSAKALIPDPKKETNLAGHVRECATRFVELKTDISDVRIEQAKTTRLIWVALGLLVAGNTSALKSIAAFITN